MFKDSTREALIEALDKEEYQRTSLESALVDVWLEFGTAIIKADGEASCAQEH